MQSPSFIFATLLINICSSLPIPDPGLSQLLPLGRTLTEACLFAGTTCIKPKAEMEMATLTKYGIDQLNAIEDYSVALNGKGKNPMAMPERLFKPNRYSDEALEIIANSARKVENWFQKNDKLASQEKVGSNVGRFIADRIDPVTKRPLRMSEEEFAGILRSHSSIN